MTLRCEQPVTSLDYRFEAGHELSDGTARELRTFLDFNETVSRGARTGEDGDFVLQEAKGRRRITFELCRRPRYAGGCRHERMVMRSPLLEPLAAGKLERCRSARSLRGTEAGGRPVREGDG